MTLAQKSDRILAQTRGLSGATPNATQLIEELRWALEAYRQENDRLTAERDEIERLRAEVERLRAGGCARDQTTTQFCAEAVQLQRRLDELEKRLSGGGAH